MQSKTAEKLMNEIPLHDQPTLESLAAEIRKLQERVEDLEDLNDLNEAIERNAGAPGVPWDAVKGELLED
jgi:hypothetical protein